MLKAGVVRVVGLAAGRPWATVAAGLVLGALALAYAATHFALTTDTAELISPKVEWRQNEAILSKAFPQQNDLSVVVIDGKTPELAEDAAARLAAKLAGDKAVGGVRRPDGGPFFAREGLLLQPLADVQATTDGLVKAQPFLGPLAADPSLRGVMTAFDTLTLGVERRRHDVGQGAEADGQHG